MFMSRLTRPFASVIGFAVATAAMAYAPNADAQTAQCGGQTYNTATQVCYSCGLTAGGTSRQWILPRFDANGNTIVYGCCGFGRNGQPYNTATRRCFGCGHDAGGVPRYWIVAIRNAQGQTINWGCCGTGTAAQPCAQ
jgi:hypothetical protein